MFLCLTPPKRREFGRVALLRNELVVYLVLVLDAKAGAGREGSTVSDHLGLGVSFDQQRIAVALFVDAHGRMSCTRHCLRSVDEDTVDALTIGSEPSRDALQRDD